MNILHIEDNIHWKNIISNTLSGHEVSTVSSAEEALSLIRDGNKFDVLITDGRLKGMMSGYTLLETPEAKQIKKRILVSLNADEYAEELKNKDYARLSKNNIEFSKNLKLLVNGPAMPPDIVYKSQQLVIPETKVARNLPNH